MRIAQPNPWAVGRPRVPEAPEIAQPVHARGQPARFERIRSKSVLTDASVAAVRSTSVSNSTANASSQAITVSRRCTDRAVATVREGRVPPREAAGRPATRVTIAWHCSSVGSSVTGLPGLRASRSDGLGLWARQATRAPRESIDGLRPVGSPGFPGSAESIAAFGLWGSPGFPGSARVDRTAFGLWGHRATRAPRELIGRPSACGLMHGATRSRPRVRRRAPAGGQDTRIGPAFRWRPGQARRHATTCRRQPGRQGIRQPDTDLDRWRAAGGSHTEAPTRTPRGDGTARTTRLATSGRSSRRSTISPGFTQ